MPTASCVQLAGLLVRQATIRASSATTVRKAHSFGQKERTLKHLVASHWGSLHGRVFCQAVSGTNHGSTKEENHIRIFGVFLSFPIRHRDPFLGPTSSTESQGKF